MLFALLLAASFSPAARSRSPQRRAPTCVERIRLAASSWPQCPLPPCPFSSDEKSGGKSNATDKVDGTGSPVDAITRAAESFERSIQDTLSTSEPLACTAAEVAIESAFRVACEELASCNVTVKSGSSLRLLQGELDFASVRATGLAIGGLRLSTLDLESQACVPAAAAWRARACFDFLVLVRT